MPCVRWLDFHLIGIKLLFLIIVKGKKVKKCINITKKVEKKTDFELDDSHVEN